MTRSFISDWTDGDSIEEVLLVRDKQVRTNRNGNMYLHLELDDRTGTISARHWNSTESESRSFEPADFLLVKGKVQLFQNQMQLIVNSFSESRFVQGPFGGFHTDDRQGCRRTGRAPRHSRGSQESSSRGDRERLSHGRERRGLPKRAPAGIRNHHAYLGGLLEHVVNLLKVSDRIGDLYPELDHDLLKLGIFLHDLGKIRELSYDRTFSYSDEGQLVGHLVIGVEMLNDKLLVAAELLGEPIPQELALELKHLILSHHGTYEFGSPKLPMTPEAIALHHLDNLDAKIHNFSRTIRDDLNQDSTWTPYDHSLSRKLFKGGRVKAQPAKTPVLKISTSTSSGGLKGGLH
ncbi:MAG: HD domain-containing protein [Planctomycetota bacterium]